MDPNNVGATLPKPAEEFGIDGSEERAWVGLRAYVLHHMVIIAIEQRNIPVQTDPEFRIKYRACAPRIEEEHLKLNPSSPGKRTKQRGLVLNRVRNHSCHPSRAAIPPS